MSSIFSNILFSFFLLLHTTAMAEEEPVPAETDTYIEAQENEVSEETESTHKEQEEQNIQEEVTQEPQEQEVDPKEVLSEAEKEALAAEAAELRELGMEEEPVVE